MNVLENRYYDVVIGEMAAFFEENGFTETEDYYKNATKALKVSYDEGKQLYNLLVADVEEEKVSEFSVISSYLFDDSQNKNDAVSVGIDFVDSARKALGVKAKTRAAVQAELPTAGSSAGVGALVTKLLAIYPTLKDTYKEEVAAKGKHLYLDFCTRFVVPEVRATIEKGTKKGTKKLIDMFIDVFTTGDRASTNLTVAILAAAIGTDAERFKKAADHMEDCPALITSVNQQVAVLVKNKKFAKAMNFEN